MTSDSLRIGDGNPALVRDDEQAVASSEDVSACPVSRVMVVDDSRLLNRILCERVAECGYEVASAATGEEALALVPELHPDVILLDVTMPGISGLEVLERLRSQRLDLAVIMTTAFGSEQVAIDALRQGADDYLRKPFEVQEFQAVLARTVSRLELRRQNAALRLQLDQRRQELERELARAAEVQADLLPHSVPNLPGFELAAGCLPARQVGGDFYDWFMKGDEVLSFSLGDVMGKGMPAALLMATVRAALRSVAPQNPPAVTATQVARALESDLMRSGSFITLFHSQLELSRRQLSYVDAGHGYTLLCRRGGAATRLAAADPPMGVLPAQTFSEGSVYFSPGDALVIYSDGLPDSRRELDLDSAALGEHLAGCATAQEMVDTLIGLAGHDPLPDDLTIAVLRCLE